MERRRIEPWRLLSSIYSFSDRWLKLRSDTVRLPGGSTLTPYHVIEAADWVNVVAISEAGCIVLVEQYRHAVQHRLVQLPAGLCDVEGEEPEAVARRELVEEAGIEAGEWTHLASTYPSPGITAEISHYYLARDVREVGRGDFEPEHEEADMTVSWVPVDDLAEAVLAGRLADSHLALAVLLARSRGLTDARVAE